VITFAFTDHHSERSFLFSKFFFVLPKKGAKKAFDMELNAAVKIAMLKLL
jgi:hypothetical protein